MRYYGNKRYTNVDLKSLLYTMLTLVAVVILFRGCEAVSDSIKYSDYVETEGIVTNSDAVLVKEFNGRYTVERDRMNISYVYMVNGTEYTGAFINDISISKGTRVRVLYNPEAPEQSKGELYSIYETDIETINQK